MNTEVTQELSCVLKEIEDIRLRYDPFCSRSACNQQEDISNFGVGNIADKYIRHRDVTRFLPNVLQTASKNERDPRAATHEDRDQQWGLNIVNNGHDTKPAYGVKSGTRSAERSRNMGLRSSDPQFMLQLLEFRVRVRSTRIYG